MYVVLRGKDLAAVTEALKTVSGANSALFDYARREAWRRGATRLTILADPYAAPFYARNGARRIACPGFRLCQRDLQWPVEKQNVLFAQLLDAEAACKLAVFLHGMAGDLADAHAGGISLIASDLVSHIGTAVQELTASRRPAANQNSGT